MFTGYKTRAWWFLRALAYAHDIVDLEDAAPHKKRPSDYDQMLLWAKEMRDAREASGAPSDDERLNPIYVDRSGNTLPIYIKSVPIDAFELAST